MSVAQIVRETSCSEASGRRAIRALTALGILSRRTPDEFAIDTAILAAMPRVDGG